MSTQSIDYKSESRNTPGGKLGIDEEREIFIATEMKRIADACFEGAVDDELGLHQRRDKGKCICEVSNICETKEELAYAMWALGAYMMWSDSLQGLKIINIKL